MLSDGQAVSYGELWRKAQQLARTLTARGVRDGDRVAFLGRRSAHDFTFILGIWLAGGAYVALNHKFPAERCRAILADARVRAVVVGPHSIDFGQEILETSTAFHVAEAEAIVYPYEAESDFAGPADLAYVMFTSGSTGKPKGVPITFGNLEAFVSNIQSQYPASSSDRMSQLADLSFDASVQEFAWCWWVGATLCPVPSTAALMWPRYAQELAMTVMLIVPSSIVLAARARLLGANALPHLRLGFLGAEAVTRDSVRVMREAAPNAQLVNLWGPTEATVFFTHFPIARDMDLPDVAPIGLPFPGQQVQVWDENDEPVDEGQPGELMQSGSQVMSGYWRNDEANRQRMVQRDGQTWYRSGDLAVFDLRVGYRYLGRVDRQVKLRGYRVELLECESAVREASGCAQAAVVPVIAQGQVSADALACFVVEPKIPLDSLAAMLKARLPEYMVPAKFIVLEQLPLGVTGKTDYKALEAMLRAGA